MGKEGRDAPFSLNRRRRCGQSEAAALLLALEADVDTQREAAPCKTPIRFTSLVGQEHFNGMSIAATVSGQNQWPISGARVNCA